MATASSAPTQSTFASLAYPDFRILWTGMIVSSVGTWMQIVAQSLLVLQLTHGNALALGTVSLASALAFFAFAFVGGSVADRFDKRTLLLVTQSIQMATAALLGVLTMTHAIQVWMIVILAFFNGSILSFDQPARSSLLSLTVPPALLLNAVSLQSMVFNGAAVLGPSLAGLTYGKIGAAGNFFLNAVSYGAVLIALLFLRMHQQERQATPTTSLFASIAEALRTVQRDDVLPWILSAYATLLFFGPSVALLLPIFATKVLHSTALQIGLLFSASGLGTILGGLLVASTGGRIRKGTILIVGFALWIATLYLFAISHIFLLSFLALLIFGIAQNMIGSSTITLMQSRVPPTMRGRMMSLNTLSIMGLRPLGDFPASALITMVGGPVTVGITTSLVALYALYMFSTRTAVREVA